MDRFYIEFGRNLRHARKKAKLSQDRVAKSVGLTRTSVTNIESGRHHVALHMAYLLANAVGKSPFELMPSNMERDIDPITDRAIESTLMSDSVKQWLRDVLAEAELREGTQ